MNKLLLFAAALIAVACQTTPSAQNVRTTCNDNPFTFGNKEFEVKGVRYSDSYLTNRAVLLFPPTGGANITDRGFAEKLCRAGFDVYMMNEWTGQNEKADDLKIHDRLYRRAIQATETVLEKVPPGFVGAMGTSVGATYVAVVVNKVERINAAFSILGGVPIPDIIVNSEQSEMRELKQRRMEKFKFKTTDDYLKALEKEFPLEPTKSPARLTGRHVSIMMSNDDKTVPTAYQLRLKDYWKPKVTIEIEGSHFGSIVTSWWKHEKDIVQFFMDATTI